MQKSKSNLGVIYHLAVAVVSFTISSSAFGEGPKPPNVLFIAVDDLACTLGCYGDRIAKTPHIDRLATRSTVFRRAYNQYPLCNPTRASVLTGLRPDTIKVYDLDRHFRDEVPGVVTLPQCFAASKYVTARVGKIYHYNVPASIGTDGFDDPPSWQETINPSGRDKSDEALVINAEPHRKISAALSWLAAEGDDAEQTDGMIASEAIAWMKRHQDEPFFLGVGFFRPHTPYIAPKKYYGDTPSTRCVSRSHRRTIVTISRSPRLHIIARWPITGSMNQRCFGRRRPTMPRFRSWTPRWDD